MKELLLNIYLQKTKKQLGKDYRFRIVKSASSLSEKAIIFEHKYDDKIIELIMGDIIAVTSMCEKNLDMKEVKLNINNQDILAIIFLFLLFHLFMFHVKL